VETGKLLLEIRHPRDKPRHSGKGPTGVEWHLRQRRHGPANSTEGEMFTRQMAHRNSPDLDAVVRLDWRGDTLLPRIPEQLQVEGVGGQDGYLVPTAGEPLRDLLEVALRSAGVRPVSLDNVKNLHRSTHLGIGG